MVNSETVHPRIHTSNSWGYIDLASQSFKYIDSSTMVPRTCAITYTDELYCWGRISSGTQPTPQKEIPPIYYDRLLEGTVNGQLQIKSNTGNSFINLSNYNISGNMPEGLSFSSDGTLLGSANYTTDNKNWTVTISNATHHWNFSLELEIIQDTDHDRVPNSEDTDDDNDGVPDSLDSCPIRTGNSTIDRNGCPDTDGDGTSNLGDPFPSDGTQSADQDGDGYGDNSAETVLMPVQQYMANQNETTPMDALILIQTVGQIHRMSLTMIQANGSILITMDLEMNSLDSKVMHVRTLLEIQPLIALVVLIQMETDIPI